MNNKGKLKPGYAAIGGFVFSNRDLAKFLSIVVAFMTLPYMLLLYGKLGISYLLLFLLYHVADTWPRAWILISLPILAVLIYHLPMPPH